MDNSDKAMFSASGTPPAESIPKKKKGKKALIIAAAVLAVIAAGLILYDTVGPGFVNCLISFDPAGGEPIESIRVKLGRSAELPDPVRENYTFTGWTLEGSMVGSPYSPEQDVTLTAEWIGNEYTVSFDMDGGLPQAEETTYRTGDLFMPPEEPSKEGYVFRGWKDPQGEKVYRGTVLPWGDVTLTAHWEFEMYDLKLDTDEGDPLEPVQYHIGDVFSSPSPAKKGYHFLGWFSSDGTEFKKGDSLPLGGLTLTAKWERNTFRVSFESNGGSHVNSITVNEGDPFNYPQAPWRDGYRFVRWTDEDGNTVSSGTVIRSSMTLYAVWEVKPAEYSSMGYEIITKNGITYVNGIMIANKTYPLPSTYAPGGLTSECNQAFEKMKAAAANDGISLWIVSGYRSYGTQESIYWRYVSNDGMTEADTYSARPGHSEHQTGLAMDLNSLYTSFGDTPEGKWLAEHCHEYGFIIRYPKGKQSITGYIYEPWHVRYLGVETATNVYESGLTLEEYLGITSKYQIASAYDQFGRN